MIFLDAQAIRALSPMSRLIDCLERAFHADYLLPTRQIARMPGGSGERLFVSMPAFDLRGAGAVKLATVVPDNAVRGLPTIHAAIVLFSETGIPVAILDGTTVTRLRTGAASALASKYLSRSDSAHLAIIGTGALAPTMVEAHCTVRPITRVSVCGRRSERAAATAEQIRSIVRNSVEVCVSTSLPETIATADIVCCATSSSAPVLAGKWLRRGTFVDLVGSFSPSAREADDDVVLRSRIFVDTFAGALAEAGDILDPLARKIISRSKIEGELADLVRGKVTGRVPADDVTLFKSVGTAIEDLAAAQMIVAELALSQGAEGPS